jgi:multimeric flavodoxin WrbA
MNATMTTAIILGSARDHGNTHQLARHLADDLHATLFNLADYDIGPYDYAHKNRDDDFLPLMKQVMRFDRFILASPVYWYSPSSSMKVFLDRLSDLMTIEKELGRLLRQKRAAVLSTGCDLVAPPCFEEIFQKTYKHLGIAYDGRLYCPCADDIALHQHHAAIDEFVAQLASPEAMTVAGSQS